MTSQVKNNEIFKTDMLRFEKDISFYLNVNTTSTQKNQDKGKLTIDDRYYLIILKELTNTNLKFN